MLSYQSGLITFSTEYEMNQKLIGMKDG